MMNDLIRTSLCATKKRFTGIANILDFEKEIGFAGQIVNNNKYLRKLAESNVPSLQRAVINVALTGLSLNPVLSLAYLIPKDGAVQLQPSYQGLCKILTDTGSVISINAQCVYENDLFDYEFGTDSYIKHKPTLKNRGEMIAVYAVATLNDGSKMFEVLGMDEINKLKNANEAVKQGKFSPWTNWGSEMARAKAIRRLYKFLPKSDRDIEKLSKVIELDNQSTDFKAEKAEFQKKQAQKADDGLFSDVEIVQEMPEQEPQEIKVVIDNEDENIELDRLAKEQESK